MRRAFGALLGVAAAVAVAGCGGPTLPQAPSTSPFEAGTVSVTQSGNAPVAVDISSVSFHLDDARTLVGSVRVTSKATTTTTVLVRVSLFSAGGGLIGDATGAQVQVAPGATVTIPLAGPTPTGTIASATVEVSLPPPPTQTPGGGPTPVSQLPTPT